MLCPAERITNRRTLVGTRSGDQRVCNFVKKRRRNATNFLHHFGRVTSKVATQRLEDAPRMLQGQIALGETKAAIATVKPGLPVVAALLSAPAGEKAGRAFFGVAKIFAQNAGGIGEVHHIISEEEIVLDNVPDEPAKKRNVAAGPDRHPDVGQCAGARKPWIDVNDGRAALLCFHDPAKADRVRFGHGGTFNQNAIGVGQILLRSRSSAPAEGGAQTGHRAAMSYPRLVGYADHSQASSKQFFYQIIFFVVEGGTAEMAYCGCVIDRRLVFFAHEVALACFRDSVG